MYQELIEPEAGCVIGAEPWECSEARTSVRNCSRPRTLSDVTPDLGRC